MEPGPGQYDLFLGSKLPENMNPDSVTDPYTGQSDTKGGHSDSTGLLLPIPLDSYPYNQDSGQIMTLEFLGNCFSKS